jgi:hypothetical protein
MSGTIQGAIALERRITAVGQVSGEKTLKGWQVRTVELAKRNLIPHKKTGNLMRSVHIGQLTENSASVDVSASYALYVEEDTRPHTIVPVHASVLAWGGPRRLTGALISGGQATHFAMVVHHPGTVGVHFLRNAAEQAASEIGIDEVVTAWNDAA